MMYIPKEHLLNRLISHFEQNLSKAPAFFVNSQNITTLWMTVKVDVYEEKSTPKLFPLTTEKYLSTTSKINVDSNIATIVKVFPFIKRQSLFFNTIYPAKK